TLHLAERVGPGGKVYAVDIDRESTRKLRERVGDLGLRPVQVVDGAEDDPRLPPGELDAILVVNAYHDFRKHDAMLRAFMRALQPGGRLGNLEKADTPGRERSSYERAHRLPENFVRDDLARNSFKTVREQPGFDPTDPEHAGEHWYFLVAEKAAGQPAPAVSDVEHAGFDGALGHAHLPKEGRCGAPSADFAKKGSSLVLLPFSFHTSGALQVRSFGRHFLHLVVLLHIHAGAHAELLGDLLGLAEVLLLLVEHVLGVLPGIGIGKRLRGLLGHRDRLAMIANLVANVSLVELTAGQAAEFLFFPTFLGGRLIALRKLELVFLRDLFQLAFRLVVVVFDLSGEIFHVLAAGLLLRQPGHADLRRIGPRRVVEVALRRHGAVLMFFLRGRRLV